METLKVICPVEILEMLLSEGKGGGAASNVIHIMYFSSYEEKPSILQ